MKFTLRADDDAGAGRQRHRGDRCVRVRLRAGLRSGTSARSALTLLMWLAMMTVAATGDQRRRCSGWRPTSRDWRWDRASRPDARWRDCSPHGTGWPSSTDCGRFATQLAAIIGPLTYGAVVYATDNNHRLAIGLTGLFFVAGLLVTGVDRHARGAARRRLGGSRTGATLSGVTTTAPRCPPLRSVRLRST